MYNLQDSSELRYKSPRACARCKKRDVTCWMDPDDPEGSCLVCAQWDLECVMTLTSERQSTTAIEAMTSGDVVQSNLDKATRALIEKQSWESAREGSASSRGRNRSRDGSRSPGPYYSSATTRSQSPAGSWYHGESGRKERLSRRESSPTLGNTNVEVAEKRPVSQEAAELVDLKDDDGKTSIRSYQYSPLLANEIRLLRISPRHSGLPLYCSLKAISLTKIKATILEFQALSYAWDHDARKRTILLNDVPRASAVEDDATDEEDVENQEAALPYRVTAGLYHALRRISQPESYTWLWVDALCINQADEAEKSDQIPHMPDIYSHAWNVIVWLGEDGFDTVNGRSAANFFSDILNIKSFDGFLQGGSSDSAKKILACIKFGSILHRPWFTRRWIIQEVACARRLSVRLGREVLSWVDFTDAVEIYAAKSDDIRKIYRQSRFYKSDPGALELIDSSRAIALLRITSSLFRKSTDAKHLTRLLDLQSLVLAASTFAVTDPRDTIFALRYLADDIHAHDNMIRNGRDFQFTADYSLHLVDASVAFLRYCLKTSHSLDMICQPWAIWPPGHRHLPYKERMIPSWIGMARSNPETLSTSIHPRHPTLDHLLGPYPHRLYNASCERFMEAEIITWTPRPLLHAKGMVLGTIQRVSCWNENGALFARSLEMLGWNGSLESGVVDKLWRTLVANRTPAGHVAPTWYRRACALALTKVDPLLGFLPLADLIADPQQSSTMVEYLKRVEVATRCKDFFECSGLGEVEEEEKIVGLGPRSIKTRDILCILYGCSVPVVIRRNLAEGADDNVYTLVGPCYVHGNMEGEIFAGMRDEIEARSLAFAIV